MSKIISNLVSILKGQVMHRNSSARHSWQVPMRVSFAPDQNTGKLTMKRQVLSIIGETKDLSATGIAFVVDSIRLREYYLVGEDRVLDVELDLPNGKIGMKIMGQRYEQIGQHLSVHKYLIGATILSMTEPDRDVYNKFLKNGNNLTKNKGSLFELEPTKG